MPGESVGTGIAGGRARPTEGQLEFAGADLATAAESRVRIARRAQRIGVMARGRLPVRQDTRA